MGHNYMGHSSMGHKYMGHEIYWPSATETCRRTQSQCILEPSAATEQNDLMCGMLRARSAKNGSRSAASAHLYSRDLRRLYL